MSGEIRVEGIRHWVGQSDRPVLDELTFRVPAGEIVAVLGPSGCGKSTLGQLLAGYERASEGRILLDGRAVTAPSTDVLVLFQENALMPWLTTVENVMFGPRARKVPKAKARAAANEVLSAMALTDFADRYPSELSGGMRRRAELARALVNDPRVLVLDEPFRGLDAMTRELMQEYTANLLVERRRTTFFVTTDVEEAILLADRLLVLSPRPGRVIGDVPVPIERPRTRLALLEDDTAAELRATVIELLQREPVSDAH